MYGTVGMPDSSENIFFFYQRPLITFADRSLKLLLDLHTEEKEKLKKN